VRTSGLVVLLLAACGAPAPELADAFTGCPAPTVAAGAAGAEVVVIETDPAPPARFENTWIVTATTADGAVATVDDVTVTAFMPAHGHYSPTPPSVAAHGAAGELEVSAMDLWMPGTWEVRFDVAGDLVVFEVCIGE
jgi:hypothetical protein